LLDTVQQFKVSPIGLISPDEKDKSGPVFMEKAAEDIPQRIKEIILAARPVPAARYCSSPKNNRV
jgi:hypothetical protein